MDPKPIDEQLRDAIRASGLTHYRLSQETGVHTSMIDRFVSGETSFKMNTAAKVARYLGLTLVKIEQK